MENWVELVYILQSMYFYVHFYYILSKNKPFVGMNTCKVWEFCIDGKWALMRNIKLEIKEKFYCYNYEKKYCNY